MDKEIYDRLDELWIVLSKGHFPEPFDDQISALESEAKIRNMKQQFRGTPSFNTDPSATSWLAVTRTAEYFKVMDELTKVNPKSPSDNDSYLTAVKHMVEVQMRHLGHALRYHNEQNPLNQKDVQPRIISYVCWPSVRRLKDTRPALEEMEIWQRSQSYLRSIFQSSRPSTSLREF